MRHIRQPTPHYHIRQGMSVSLCLITYMRQVLQSTPHFPTTSRSVITLKVHTRHNYTTPHTFAKHKKNSPLSSGSRFDKRLCVESCFQDLFSSGFKWILSGLYSNFFYSKLGNELSAIPDSGVCYWLIDWLFKSGKFWPASKHDWCSRILRYRFQNWKTDFQLCLPFCFVFLNTLKRTTSHPANSNQILDVCQSGSH